MTVILGADLSYSRTGLVWYDMQTNKVTRHATVTIKPGPNRLLRALNSFRDAICQNYLELDRLVIEGPALNSPNPRTLHMLGELSGVFKLLCESYGIAYKIAVATEVRKFIVGSGRADKAMLAKALRMTYGIKFDNDDAPGYDLTDAAALCVWEANR